MSFLYPSFLWALAVLSVPVIIHLFNFRRTTRVYFSNTRFLKQVKEASTAKRKLKHYLILAARLLFLFFLVVTFCQPVIPAREQMGANQNIVLYLDNSQSMSAQTDDKTRGLDAAVSFARSIVDVFPPDTRYRLITNDFSPFSNTYKTKAEVLDLLTQVRLSPVSRTYAEIQERIRQEGTRRNPEIFWVSDLQKSTLGPITTAPDSSTRLHVVPIAFGQLSNVFVDSAYLENPFSAGGGKNVLHVKVRNDGRKDVEQLNLKLTINGVQAGTSLLNVPQAGIAETTFDLTTGLSGLNKARITFNDFPVSFDNEFFVALNFTDKITVLEIKNTPGATVVEKVFGNKDVFRFASYPVNNFNYSLLPQADLVVVNGLNSIDASLGGALRRYVSDQGTLLVVPGSTPDAASLRGFLQLPTLKLTENKTPAELDRPDFSNPFFENIFEEKSVALAMPKATRRLDWGADNTALLKFKDGTPFLSMFAQQGKLYVMACALEADQTDFFNHAVFVPVMYRMAASGKRNELKPYYTLSEDFITLHVDSLKGEEPLRWVGAEEVVPAQRNVNDDVIFDIPKFSIVKGFYNVVMRRDTINLLAFNLDKAESLMAQFSGEEVKAALGGGDNITIFKVGSADAFSKEIKERYLGTPLWKYALLLALTFLLAEILLIRFLK
ncbi:vWA domain-containing protein [Chryseolinea lacunae]|uniref:BatA and WFA domain-containing protein n=1 Tax=Chryseolinea lacunae TaxID=2801331 RepID=A0ABS1L0D2_9BACT|nr:BatA and WFA domain-containing protein [Chryseolinea lacunae]MBL0745149.1 BatA and WFA domain-containing protein [Chryseolinea lacunae]